MGRVIGTCCHEIPNDWWDSGEGDIAWGDYDKEGKRVVVYGLVCKKCLSWYKKKMPLLKTEKEEEQWLSGE